MSSRSSQTHYKSPSKGSETGNYQGNPNIYTKLGSPSSTGRLRCVKIYHLFPASTAVSKSVILPMAVLGLDELLQGAESSAEG
jgi:hypothetical protein